MFDKSDNNIKKVDLQIDTLYQHNDVLLSPSLVQMINNKDLTRQMEEKNDYQNNVVNYIDLKHENKIKKQYNPKISNLYYNGLLLIGNDEYRLKDFFIVFDNKLNNFHIKCINNKYNNDDIEYNKAIRFIDTTAFINLINHSKVLDNKIIINDSLELNNVVTNWDGYIHGEVAETDAIMDKKMIEVNK